MCLPLRTLVQGICSYLNGNATAEESEGTKKNLEHIDQELGASGHGLLDDQEVCRLEDDLAAVYCQLSATVRKLSLDLKRVDSRANLFSIYYGAAQRQSNGCNRNKTISYLHNLMF